MGKSHIAKKSAGTASPAAFHRLIVEPDDGHTPILQLLANATKTIDLGIYLLGDPQITSALVAAARRGVAVRVLYNWYSFSARSQQTDVTPYISLLSKAGVAVRIAPKTFEVTHEKIFIIDSSSAVVMSFNLATAYFGQTRDFGIVTTVAAEVAEIEAVFSADWNSKSITPSVPSLVWSPVNSRSKLTALINGAVSTLDVYIEEAEDPGTLAALVAAVKRKVTVRVITAVLSGSGKVNANAAGITFLRGGGVDAVCKSFLYIHAKMILADAGATAAKAFIGSENLSCVSLGDNRECGMIISEAAILQRLETVFESDWSQPSVTVVADDARLSPCAKTIAARTAMRVAQRSLRHTELLQ